MSIRKIMVGVAAGVVGLGALWVSRAKEGISNAAGSKWARSVRLAEKQDHAKGVAVDGDYVYFVTGGFANAENAVLRVKTSGGPVEKLAQVKPNVTGELIVDGNYVYFGSDGGQAIFRVPKTGGTAIVIAEAPAPVGLTSDATHLYFGSFSRQPETGVVWRVSKTGGQPEAVLRGQLGLDQIVVDDQAIYFRSNSGLWKVKKSGGQPENLVPYVETKNLDRLSADSTYLYFFYESQNRGKYEVARLPKAGGKPETIGPIGNVTGRLALSDTHVYYFRGVSLYDDELIRVPKAGGKPETVDGTGYNTGFLQVSGAHVYFTDGSSVFKVPK